jgi:hypothetical protein
MKRDHWLALAASGCLFVSMFWGCGDDETEATGAGGSPNGPATGTGPVTSTGVMSGTSTSSGGPDCTDAMPPLGNMDPVCTQCVKQACCTQLETCNGGGDCGPLFQCAGMNCQQQCVYPLCMSGIGYIILQDCATCAGNDCCDEVTACVANSNCNSCLLMGNQQGCDATQLDEQYNTCVECNCATQCTAILTGSGGGGGTDCSGGGGPGGGGPGGAGPGGAGPGGAGPGGGGPGGSGGVSMSTSGSVGGGGVGGVGGN